MNLFIFILFIITFGSNQFDIFFFFSNYFYILNIKTEISFVLSHFLKLIFRLNSNTIFKVFDSNSFKKYTNTMFIGSHFCDCQVITYPKLNNCDGLFLKWKNVQRIHLRFFF